MRQFITDAQSGQIERLRKELGYSDEDLLTLIEEVCATSSELKDLNMAQASTLIQFLSSEVGS